MLVSQYETLLIFVVINLVLVYHIGFFMHLFFPSLILQSANFKISRILLQIQTFQGEI